MKTDRRAGGVRAALDRTRSELERTRAELHELNRIGVALMAERDPERLMDSVLTQARGLTTSDAGRLYLVERDENGAEFLRFVRSQNDSMPDLAPVGGELPIDEHSIAGYAAISREAVALEDVHDLPDGLPFSFDRWDLDESRGYHTRSMLLVPMLDHRDRRVGVLQLINRKRDESATIRSKEDADRWVLPYTDHEVSLLSSLAGQAAVSIENARLYRDIENLFAGFIKTAVTALDQRDPSTAGHSVRVTELSCGLAEHMNRVAKGAFENVTFDQKDLKQLRYAGLLHDFGKVGIREETLVKRNKLSPVLEAQVDARFDLIRSTLEHTAAERRAGILAECSAEDAAPRLRAIDQELARDLSELDRSLAAVRAANIPRVLGDRDAQQLREIARKTFEDVHGNVQPYLTERELHYLSIPKGNLDAEERAQIESHVVHSYDFLVDIPWTEELSRIAEIVRGHHEKLDGTGYPDGVTGERLSLETRIMTVCDIFDALTASDRPYKKAVPVDEALEILRAEAAAGALDADIVELFIESEVYRRVLEKDWREL